MNTYKVPVVISLDEVLNCMDDYSKQNFIDLLTEKVQANIVKLKNEYKQYGIDIDIDIGYKTEYVEIPLDVFIDIKEL